MTWSITGTGFPRLTQERGRRNWDNRKMNSGQAFDKSATCSEA
jgi:hypothetical protein